MMYTIERLLVCSVFCLTVFACADSESKKYDVTSVASSDGTEVFQPDWENIAANYRFPSWFQDGKFGIFIHWGVYSVPAFGSEWYSRIMYQKGSPEYRHHIETWGPHDRFGYKDFIPLFTAENFDAEEWLDLFKEAGARYIVPVAEHHDGFAMYDSDINPWNAVRMGPEKDIIALLKKASRKAGLVFGLSTHRLENAWFYNGGKEFPSDVQDTTITLYGKRLANEKYTEEVAEEWLEHTYELITKYEPQLVYFDWTVNHPTVVPYFNRVMAYYYNSALDWGKEVVINTKQGYPTNTHVWDVERGKAAQIMKYPWQTCTSIGKKSWSHVEGEENKTPEQIVHDLIDIVSKNGNLLLNVGPRADGTITDEQKNVLLSIGSWLKVNGEAIYGTRCWKKYGEGVTEGTKGSFTDSHATQYTVQDIRFTTKGNDFYAITLDWGEEVVIHSLNRDTVQDAVIRHVSLLGSDETILWTMTEDGLKIRFPQQRPCDYAYAFKISFDKEVGTDLVSDAATERMKHGG